MLLERSNAVTARNTLSVMPDERAVAAAPRRITPLRVVGWAAYLVALVLFVVFVVMWIRGDVATNQQLYPIPGIAAGFLVIGIWTALGPALYKSRSTATLVGKYVLAVVVSVGVFPTLVTIVSGLAGWLVSLDPGRVH
jgi:predicted anti-sigma-YlaC factor YlaD